MKFSSPYDAHVWDASKTVSGVAIGLVASGLDYWLVAHCDGCQIPPVIGNPRWYCSGCDEGFITHSKDYGYALSLGRLEQGEEYAFQWLRYWTGQESFRIEIDGVWIQEAW